VGNSQGDMGGRFGGGGMRRDNFRHPCSYLERARSTERSQAVNKLKRKKLMAELHWEDVRCILRKKRAGAGPLLTRGESGRGGRSKGGRSL